MYLVFSQSYDCKAQALPWSFLFDITCFHSWQTFRQHLLMVTDSTEEWETGNLRKLISYSSSSQTSARWPPHWVPVSSPVGTNDVYASLSA